MSRHDPKPQPGCFPENPDELIMRHLQSMVFMGTPIELAENLCAGTAGRPGELQGVLLVLQRGDSGLFVNLTPEGARKVAEKLIASADKAEARGAEQVQAALGAILKGGKA